MKARLRVLTQQRDQLLAEIDLQRTQLRARSKIVRQDLAYAGLGFLAARLLARRPWLRALTLAALALAASHLRTAGHGAASSSD